MWMVLDFNKFTPSNPLLISYNNNNNNNIKKEEINLINKNKAILEDGLLTVLEEVPGFIHVEDLTYILRNKSYFPSYNNPFFNDIREKSGYNSACQLDETFCYEKDPRAEIFSEINILAKDISSMMLVMGDNRFDTDPLSRNDSCNVFFYSFIFFNNLICLICLGNIMSK